MPAHHMVKTVNGLLLPWTGLCLGSGWLGQRAAGAADGTPGGGCRRATGCTDLLAPAAATDRHRPTSSGQSANTIGRVEL